jgi:hypothetical protein
LSQLPQVISNRVVFRNLAVPKPEDVDVLDFDALLGRRHLD